MARTKKIKILMIERGISGRWLARRVRRSDSIVSRVIHGQKKSRRIEDAIARALGVPVEELFPYRSTQAA